MEKHSIRAIDPAAFEQLINEVDSPNGSREVAIAALTQMLQMKADAGTMCREGHKNTPPENSSAETYRYIENGAEWITCRHNKPHKYKLRDLKKA